MALKKPPPLVPNILDGFLGSDRSLRDHLVGDCVHHRLAVGTDTVCRRDPLHLLRFDQLHRVVRSEVLHHALRHQQQRADDAERQQHPELDRVRSTQKLPMVSFSRRAMPRMNAMASAMPTAAETKL